MTAVLNPSAVNIAQHQIARIAETTQTLCEAMDAEHTAILARDDYLTLASTALIGQPNPATSKPHSQASAEAAIKDTTEYRRLASARIDAEKARLCASAAWEASKLAARLSVAVIEHAIPTGDLH